jgi:hypothetical protein
MSLDNMIYNSIIFRFSKTMEDVSIPKVPVLYLVAGRQAVVQ